MIQVVIAQVGTVEKLSISSVRKYLFRFLSDDRIIDLPRILWWPLLLLIVPLRARKSFRYYQSIWDKEDSPMLHISEKQKKLLQKELGNDIHVDLFLSYTDRYSMKEVERSTLSKQVSKVIVFPLFPQYSTATTASIADVFFETYLGWSSFGKKKKVILPELHFISRFYQDSEYQSLLTCHIRHELAKLPRKVKTVVVSFHGLPKRYIKEGDSYQKECEETFAFLKEAFLKEGYTLLLSYQSRFGPEKWLGPTTKETLEGCARNQESRPLAVVCPGFTTDCLETLYEINKELRADFVSSGGKSDEFFYVPCLNDSKDFISFLAQKIRRMGV